MAANVGLHAVPGPPAFYVPASIKIAKYIYTLSPDCVCKTTQALIKPVLVSGFWYLISFILSCEDSNYYSNNKSTKTRMHWTGTSWDVCYLNDDDAEVLWCRCPSADAVHPGNHIWEMFEVGGSKMCEFETRLNN